MQFLFSSTIKDLRRRLKDPIALGVWLGIPLMIGGLISLGTGGAEGPTPKAHVLLVDQDDSFLSNLFASSEGPEGMGELLEVERVELEEGRARIDAGDATALLLLPDGFQEGVLEETPTELTLITNPAQRILPRIVEEALDMLVEATFYLQRVLGEPLRQIAAGPRDGESSFSDEAIGALSVEINQRMTGLSGTLFPPLLQVENEVEEEEAAPSIGILFIPGIVFMSLMFIAQGMSDDVWREKSQGTLRRLVSTPRSVSVFLGGKLLTAAILMVVIAILALGVGAVAFDVPPIRLPIALLWCVFAGAALFCYFVVLQLFATSERAGTLLTTIIMFPLLMIGGSFFPFETMPDWMAAVGKWTPNGLAVARLKEILVGEITARSLVMAIVCVGAPAALAFLVAVHRLRGRFTVA